MIPLIARDLAVAYAAGVVFTLGGLTPLAAVAALVTLLWKARRK